MKFRGFIFDINGTIVHNHSLLGGAIELFAFLKQTGMPYILLTNDSSLSPQDWEDKFCDLGLLITSNKVLTSGSILIDYFEKNIDRNDDIYMIGNKTLNDTLKASGFKINQAEKYQVVLMGFDKKIDFKKIRDAAIYIGNGAKFFITNPDRLVLFSDSVAPGNGAFAKVLESTTSVRPINIGKPSQYAIELAAQKLNVPKDEILIVGDNLETDIAGANTSGIKSALIRTGLANYISSAIEPDFIFDDLFEFAEFIK